MSTVLLLSTADTDLLAARASGASYRIGNPTRVEVGEELPGSSRARTSPSSGCWAASVPGRTGSPSSRRPLSRPSSSAARPSPTPS